MWLKFLNWKRGCTESNDNFMRWKVTGSLWRFVSRRHRIAVVPCSNLIPCSILKSRFFFGGADRCACRCCAIWAHAVKPKAQVRHHEERYRTARASLSRAEESVAVLSTELASARDHISQLELKEASQATALSGLERDFSTAQAQRKALENEKAHLVQEHAAKLDEYARTEQSLREQLDDQAEVLRGVRQAADVRTRDAEDRYKKQLDVV